MTDDAPANGTPGRPGDGPDRAAEPDPPQQQPGQPPQPGQPGQAGQAGQAGQPGAAGPTVRRPREPQDAPPPAPAPPTPPATGVEGQPVSPATTAIPTAAEPWPGDRGHGGPPVPPSADPDAAAKAGRSGPAGALAAVGAGLLGAAVVISRIRSRSDGDLDWSNYAVGLGATAVLLLIALVGAATAGRREGDRARADVVTWPGVVGILGVALMIDVGANTDDDWLGYLIGGVVVVLAAVGYLLSRRAAFVVTAIVGLGILYAMGFDELVAQHVSGDDRSVVESAALCVFVLVVTVLGWVLPSRVVSGVAVGAFGLLGYVGMLLGMLAMRLLGDLFGGQAGWFAATPLDGPGADGGGPMSSVVPGASSAFRESDVWWTVAFVGVLTLVWALAAMLSNHSGFAILAIAAPLVVVPLASAVLAVAHPTWWSAVVAAAGGLLLLGAAALARGRGRRRTRPTY